MKININGIEIETEKLKGSKTTFKLPKNGDGTITFYLKDNDLFIKCNEDFIDNYEKELKEGL